MMNDIRLLDQATIEAIRALTEPKPVTQLLCSHIDVQDEMIQEKEGRIAELETQLTDAEERIRQLSGNIYDDHNAPCPICLNALLYRDEDELFHCSECDYTFLPPHKQGVRCPVCGDEKSAFPTARGNLFCVGCLKDQIDAVVDAAVEYSIDKLTAEQELWFENYIAETRPHERKKKKEK
jgi:hypothetical protein